MIQTILLFSNERFLSSVIIKKHFIKFFLNIYRQQNQGCQMVYFKTKNPDLCKFCRALVRKILIYFMAIGNILQIFGIFYDHLLYTLCSFGTFFQILVSCTKKSGNPEQNWTDKNTLFFGWTQSEVQKYIIMQMFYKIGILHQVLFECLQAT
jgi:hypothetical protein